MAKFLTVPAMVLASFLAFACSGVASRVPPPPNPPQDTDLCQAMCEHLMAIGCEEGKPLYNSDLPGPVDVPNQSCSDNCKELQTKGFFFNPKCVIDAPTCDQIEPYRERDSSTCGVHSK